MRFALIAAVMCVCGVVRGEDAAGAPVSVLNHGNTPAAAAPAAAPEAAAAPIVVVESAPVVASCRNGRCCTTPECRLYNVEEATSESCRRLLFGGYVKKNTTRTVYRPSRR
jgi:hypothetical protein